MESLIMKDSMTNGQLQEKKTISLSHKRAIEVRTYNKIGSRTSLPFLKNHANEIRCPFLSLFEWQDSQMWTDFIIVQKLQFIPFWE